MNLLYFDTSAIIKLIRQEAESEALRAWLADPARHEVVPVCSALALVELPRALRRLATGIPLPDYRATLERFTLRNIDEEILSEAGAFPAPTLRSLDAIHLAMAHSLFAAAAESFEALITYDARLGDAASAMGVPVVAPR